MVKYKNSKPDGSNLDAIFSALGDSTRRSILSRLSGRSASIGEIAAPYEMSLPAVSKHLKVLERAGLLIRTRQGRTHRCHVAPKALEAANGWIEHMRGFWEDSLDNLDTYLRDKKGIGDEHSRNE